jgi:hypothetical protein
MTSGLTTKAAGDGLVICGTYQPYNWWYRNCSEVADLSYGELFLLIIWIN